MAESFFGFSFCNEISFLPRFSFSFFFRSVVRRSAKTTRGSFSFLFILFPPFIAISLFFSFSMETLHGGGAGESATPGRQPDSGREEEERKEKKRMPLSFVVEHERERERELLKKKGGD